jgi:hypothetical protein
MWEISSSLADRLFAISNVLLMAGAAAVLIGTIGTIVMSGVREQFTNERISTNEAITKRAIADSDIAKKGAAEATERAAIAEQRAAEADLKLEQFKAPRVLSSDKQQGITDKLKPFAGTVFDAGIGPKGDPEPIYLIRSISAALSLAGWKFIPWTGGGETLTEPPMPPIGLTAVTNVIIDVYPDYWKKFGAAATALAAALADADIAAIADSKPTSINAEAIHVRIGRKL